MINETPMIFSGLEAQGEINWLEELFGSPERIYRGIPRGRGYYGIPDIFAKWEQRSPSVAGRMASRDSS